MTFDEWYVASRRWGGDRLGCVGHRAWRGELEDIYAVDKSSVIIIRIMKSRHLK